MPRIGHTAAYPVSPTYLYRRTFRIVTTPSSSPYTTRRLAALMYCAMSLAVYIALELAVEVLSNVTVGGSVTLVACIISYALFAATMYRVLRSTTPITALFYLLFNLAAATWQLFSSTYLLQVHPELGRYEANSYYADAGYTIVLFLLAFAAWKSPYFPSWLAVLQLAHAVSWGLETIADIHLLSPALNTAFSIVIEACFVVLMFALYVRHGLTAETPAPPAAQRRR